MFLSGPVPVHVAWTVEGRDGSGSSDIGKMHSSSP